ncbi:3-hydroxyisobutyrate dehydrogenase [Sinomonas sp. JGH33]|uniref:3-hydroxyisobutyrate dehydrogenase n=1 Tax=Sinomonas terricola TaxID=3110330 RepID=A0ABU5T2S7_9MICC|nr:3-hydroxyisobutyrate dehydrogenase [Sinomonas sp. JGH33]MEA5453961.1 3-hydroxyisobutyrate dehydrogenase [Sinomonas sp. JGH33]
MSHAASPENAATPESRAAREFPQGRIAFLGLGHMGGPMAANLVKAGKDVVGYDPVPAAADAARAHGVKVAESALDAAAGASVVLTMLQAGQQVLDLYRGTEDQRGLLEGAAPRTMFLDCSTINVNEAREAAAVVTEAGYRFIDAPVSGGVVGAEAATLTFMVGAEDADFAEVEPLLELMGKRVVHCGGHGSGQAAKVCNNMILGASMIAVCEAFVLGEKLGITHDVLFDVAAHASGQCWALTTNCPVPGPVPTSPANRNYEPGFTGALMAKDLHLALQAVESTGVAARVGPLAAKIYDEFVEHGGATRDFSGIITDIRYRSNP